VTDGRLRERQGRARLLRGAPCPDPATTASLLPGVVVGAYLRDHADVVRGRVLDLGAGNQPYADWYGPLCDDAVAVDVAAHDGIAALSVGEALPFRDGSFDTVLATEVLEHVDDAEAAMAEIRRVLRPGGAAIVTVPFLYPTHEAPHDHRRFTHHGLAGLAVRHGLQVEDLAAKGGAAVVVLNVAVTVVCAVLRAVMLRAPLGAARSLAGSGLDGIERALLTWRLRTRPFPRSAARASLGYLAVLRSGQVDVGGPTG
jgi:SAM-dependent methyltransferase